MKVYKEQIKVKVDNEEQKEFKVDNDKNIWGKNSYHKHLR